MPELDDLLAVLALDPTGDRSWSGGSLDFGAGAVVFGGQLLAQTIVAAATVDPAKTVKSVHTVFARGASTDLPLEFAVDVMQQGRSFASASVTVSQGERLCTRSLVLLHAPDPDLIRHQDAVPDVPSAAGSTPSTHGAGFWEIRTVGGVDIADPDAVGPAHLDVWTRFPDAPDDPTINQALLAFATDGFLIGTAMRPHAGSRPVPGPSVDLDECHHPHADVPRPGGRLRLAPARPGEPGGRSRSQLRAGPRVRRGRRPRGLVRAGEHDPRLRHRSGATPRRPGRPLTARRARGRTFGRTGEMP